MIYLPTVQILSAAFNVPVFPDIAATASIARVIPSMRLNSLSSAIRLTAIEKRFFFLFNPADINECDDPALSGRCVENAECCNLPSNFLCKCKPGYIGDGEVRCDDVDECAIPGACGDNTVCRNIPGNYSCTCQDGFTGDPYDSVSTYNGVKRECAAARERGKIRDKSA